MRHPQHWYFPQFRCNMRKISAKRYRRAKLLEKEINDLEIQDNFDETSTLVHDKKLELMTIRENKVRGTILRSKVKWIEEGEKPT